MIPCQLELHRLLSKLDLDFQNDRNPYRAPTFFTGNIANIIHRSPMNESSGGGGTCRRDACLTLRFQRWMLFIFIYPIIL